VAAGSVEFYDTPLQHFEWRCGAARAVFTLRDGGVSEREYDSLNLGLHVADDVDAVHENRLRVLSVAGIPEARSAMQVHGTQVLVEPADGWTHEFPDHDADALVTAVRERGLAIMVADCAPLVIATEARIAAVHVGWRGLLSGVVEAALDELDVREGAPAHAVLGPCIGPCCFEVGDEVATQFAPAHVSRIEGERAHVDLRSAIELRLAARGIALEVIRVCTSCDRRCFSHRRDQGATGRQGVLAWLAAD